jgi:two-component system response regulator VicR
MNTSANPNYKILVVDDDLDVNTTFALLLEFDGHEVQTAYTGEAALAMLEKSKFDLIITEYWLPRMKGDELAAIVKQRWRDLPIIMATANSEELSNDVHPISGVDCLLNKPFSMPQLREAMIWVIDRYSENRQSDPGIHKALGDQREETDNPRSPFSGSGER